MARDATDVRCPTCDAGAGHPCRWKGGRGRRPITLTHRSRSRLFENEEKEKLDDAAFAIEMATTCSAKESRDHFAGLAMASLVLVEYDGSNPTIWGDLAECIAEDAYAMADAMIRASRRRAYQGAVHAVREAKVRASPSGCTCDSALVDRQPLGRHRPDCAHRRGAT